LVFVLGLLVVECDGAKGVCPGRFPMILPLLLVVVFGDGIDILGTGLFLLRRPPPPPLPEEFVANDRTKRQLQKDDDADNDVDDDIKYW